MLKRLQKYDYDKNNKSTTQIVLSDNLSRVYLLEIQEMDFGFETIQLVELMPVTSSRIERM